MFLMGILKHHNMVLVILINKVNPCRLCSTMFFIISSIAYTFVQFEVLESIFY